MGRQLKMRPSIARVTMPRILLLCISLFASQTYSASPDVTANISTRSYFPSFSPQAAPKQKVIAVNLTGIGIISAWGIRYWNYAEYKPHVTSEEWFGRNTRHGGADKFGHFYSGYAIANILADAFEDWGYTQKQAALYSGLSASLITGYMEIGDAFSRFGFSKQDFIMNIAGSLASYALYTHPDIGKKINIRAEYIPTGTTDDPVTDYDGMKYLIALRMDGFEKIAESPLGLIEFHLGYYARGYENDSSLNKQRNVYAGVGLNISNVMRRIGWKKVAYVFNYIQPPLTYIENKTDLNQ